MAARMERGMMDLRGNFLGVFGGKESVGEGGSAGGGGGDRE